MKQTFTKFGCYWTKSGICSINNGSNSHQKRATDDKYNFTVTPKKLTKLISPVRKNNVNQSSISLLLTCPMNYSFLNWLVIILAMHQLKLSKLNLFQTTQLSEYTLYTLYAFNSLTHPLTHSPISLSLSLSLSIQQVSVRSSSFAGVYRFC